MSKFSSIISSNYLEFIIKEIVTIHNINDKNQKKLLNKKKEFAIMFLSHGEIAQLARAYGSYP